MTERVTLGFDFTTSSPSREISMSPKENHNRRRTGRVTHTSTIPCLVSQTYVPYSPLCEFAAYPVRELVMLTIIMSRQFRDAAWNLDGPLYSPNCAVVMFVGCRKSAPRASLTCHCFIVNWSVCCKMVVWVDGEG